MKRLLFLFFLYILPFSFSYANDNIKATLSAPASVEVDKAFKLVFTIHNASADSFSLPKMKGIRLVSGPSKSSSSNYYMEGGKMVASTSVSLVYIAIADKKGNFEIPSASIWSKGEKYTTNAAKISVVSQSASTKKQSEQAKRKETKPQSIPDANPEEVSGEDVFVKTEWENSDVFAGKHNNLVVKLYYRVNVAGIDNIKWPTIKNCEVTDAPVYRNSLYGRAQVNGTLYNTVIVGKKDIVPSKTSKLTIDSGSLDVIINVPNKNDFWGGYHRVSQHLVIPGISIKVKEASEDNAPTKEQNIEQPHWNL